MKVNELWLREWVDPRVNTAELASQLTMAGLEVDAVHPVAGEFSNVIVAEVVRVTKHPQADKLSLCEVNTGTEPDLKIVCGAANVRDGLKVALAQVGAKLPGGLSIKKAKLRGEPSFGMLCSSSELGLTDRSEGIMELPEDAPIGMDLREYMQLDDQVFDIDLTPNRGDCFSVLGIAREVAAYYQLDLARQDRPSVKATINDVLTVRIDEPEACLQYVGRIIRHINPNAESPLWLVERLRRCGIRPLHPVVDVTNFVMLELGQPMHAFDFTKVQQDILVRYAKQGEQLTLLDGKTVTLDETTLVIADEHQALAIAGVMGGESSAVNQETIDIFLESALFNPPMISGVARRFGLSTDSSQRFERGVDPALPSIALERATTLLQQIVGGEAGPVIVAEKQNATPPQHQITFDPSKVARLTGIDIDVSEMQRLLEALGMEVSAAKVPWGVSVPSYRFDLTLDVDLIEEVVRLYGYDKFPTQAMIAPIQAGTPNSRMRLTSRMSHFFVRRGYHESINYSFVDPAIQTLLYPDVKVMRLLNPLSPELSVMRVGLWPGLLAAMIHNKHRQQSVVKLFESGVAFDVGADGLQERPCLAGLLTGEIGSLNWADTTRLFDFYDGKGDLDTLFKLLRLDQIQYQVGEHAALHPGQTAQIMLSGKQVGWVGLLHPKISEALDVADDVVLFELNIDALLLDERAVFKPISKYPNIRRDLSFLVNKNVEMAAIEGVVREIIPSRWLKQFDVFDVYLGDSVPEGQKSVAIALTLQDNDRTLVDEEINQVIDALIDKLGVNFSISLRD